VRERQSNADLASFPNKQDFKSAATGVSAKAMRNEIKAMIDKIDDPEYKRVRSPRSVSKRRRR
jgi:hypothetical protein